MTNTTGKLENIIIQKDNTKYYIKEKAFREYLREKNLLETYRKCWKTGKSITKGFLYLQYYKYYEDFINESYKFKTFYFVTINPRPLEIDPLTWKKCYSILNGFLALKPYRNCSYEYIVEQRGEFEKQGTHYHLVIQKSVKKSKILTDLKRVFGREFKKFNIHIYIINNKEILFDKREYLRGHKDPSKDLKLMIDNELRKEEGIENNGLLSNMGCLYLSVKQPITTGNSGK